MKIEHRPTEKRFVVELDGREGELTYREIRPGVLDYNHTWIPPDLRGTGTGGKLVRHALDYARSAGYSVFPGCSFVARFMTRFRKYADLRADAGMD